MLHHKAFRFRSYPTEEQTTLIHQMYGCARFVLTTSWRDGTTPSKKQAEACQAASMNILQEGLRLLAKMG
ncbi:helix-turn-helix domain-containing protein [Paenibacillus sp. MZ04-78.2]|uniref:helix-turn-helix domain-containing protein n=1 Tax=Paenibacillus sp. MZ04-78.2 TaxID=2962034 RepID=UPI0020B68B63|nr:helix-turn-helix domain-containing protein [Paenibacillus sp. MZ04-78.2]MCP3773564.1 helix-turn-helix domain-containing protein [Paenibacillus sp. MZ04-78.2]